jgi:hypothetical protein
MVIKMSDYIMESCISEADASVDIVNEQTTAEIEVSSKIVDAYAKQAMMLEYYYQEGDETGSSFGRKMKDFFGKIIEGIKHAIEAVCKWFRTIFEKIAGLFKRDQKQVVASTKEVLESIPEDKRSEFHLTVTREEFDKFAKSDDSTKDLSFDDLVDQLNEAPELQRAFDNWFLPAIKKAEEAIKDLVGEEDEATKNRALQQLNNAERDMNRLLVMAGGKATSKFPAPGKTGIGHANVDDMMFGTKSISKDAAKSLDKSDWDKNDGIVKKKGKKSDVLDINYQQALEIVDAAERYIMTDMEAKLNEIAARIKEIEDSVARIKFLKAERAKTADSWYKPDGTPDIERIDEEISIINARMAGDRTEWQLRDLAKKKKDLETIKASGGASYRTARDRDASTDHSDEVIQQLKKLQETLRATHTAVGGKFSTIYSTVKGLLPKIKKVGELVTKGKKDEAQRAERRRQDWEEREKLDQLGIAVDDNGNLSRKQQPSGRNDNGGTFDGYKSFSGDRSKA